ncbi:Protein sickie, partial [Anthophora retusa]
MSGASELKPSVIFPRGNNGAKPKNKISKAKSLIPSLNGNSSSKSQESNTDSPSSSPAKSHTSVSSTSPRRTSQNVELNKRSPRKYLQEDRQQTVQLPQYSSKASPKRSPRRYVSALEEDFLQDEMGFGLRVSSTGGGNEPGMSFLEFESLYTLEKELIQLQQDMGQVDDRCIFGGWFGRKGLYTELPDPFYQQAVAAAVAPLQVPTEGFSFAPGWSLSVEHFYQWQHRGKTTQQVFYSMACIKAPRSVCGSSDDIKADSTRNVIQVQQISYCTRVIGVSIPSLQMSTLINAVRKTQFLWRCARNRESPSTFISTIGRVYVWERTYLNQYKDNKEYKKREETARAIIIIYADWANYYLERGGCKRRVTDLQTDLCDGVLLADLVEAVTNQKVIDVNRKPRNAQQMVSFRSKIHYIVISNNENYFDDGFVFFLLNTLPTHLFYSILIQLLLSRLFLQLVENVSLCIGALRALGADVGSVNPGELAAGSTLWPVLALLFALSRYKQRAKQLQDMPR